MTTTSEGTPPQPRVSVIVVNFNGGHHLTRCLAAVVAQSFRDFELLLVDNGSSDRSIEMALESCSDPRLQVISLGHNAGFAVANNLAAAQAHGQWLALLNPDAFPASDWLACLLDATERYPGAGLFGSTQIDATNLETFDGLGDGYFAAGIPWRGGFGWPTTILAVEGEVFSPCAAAALYRADLFRALGGLDERFFCYVEDVDLGFRFRLMGWPAIQAAQAVVYHVGGASSGQCSGFARYHGTRNMIWTFVKNMPAPLFWLLLPAHIAAMVFLLLRSVRRGDFSDVAKGIGDALCDLPAVWRQRLRIQATKLARSPAIARSITWNPNTYVCRKADIRAIR